MIIDCNQNGIEFHHKIKSELSIGTIAFSDIKVYIQFLSSSTSSKAGGLEEKSEYIQYTIIVEEKEIEVKTGVSIQTFSTEYLVRFTPVN